MGLALLKVFFLEIKTINENSVSVEEFGDVSDEESQDCYHIWSETPNLKNQSVYR